MKEKKISKSDPESGYYVKGEREKQFAYSAHTVCDENGFVLGASVTPGNVRDSQEAVPLLEKSVIVWKKRKLLSQMLGTKRLTLRNIF